MSSEPTLLFANAAEWRAWLLENHNTSGVWLKIAKKGSKSSSLLITEALDTALCFGWIDSQRKGLDADCYLQRYSRRSKKSPWSLLNRQRAEKLVAEGRMTDAGFQEIEAAQRDGRWDSAYESQTNYTVPEGLLAAMKEAGLGEAFQRLAKTEQYLLVLPLLKAGPRREAVMAKILQSLQYTDRMSTNPLRHLTVTIERDVTAVYTFASNPLNLPLWAQGLGQGVTPDGDRWRVKTDQGFVGLLFTAHNTLGVLDHTVLLPDGTEVYVPMRVVPNGTGSEVVFTLFRQPEMDDTTFERDAGLVQADLLALKALLEKELA